MREQSKLRSVNFTRWRITQFSHNSHH